MTAVNHVPDGYTPITPYLIVENASALIDFLVSAFGAVERLRLPMPEGGIGHAEVVIDGAPVMLADSMDGFPVTSSIIHLYITDTDAVYARALSARRNLHRRARRPVLRRPPSPHNRPLRKPMVHLHPHRRRRPRRAHDPHRRPRPKLTRGPTPQHPSVAAPSPRPPS